MADIGYIRSQLVGIKDETARRILTTIFEHVLGNLREGSPRHQTRSENFQRYWENSTTASDTGEFSFAHGLVSTPQYAIPVLELDKPGAKLVPLEVSRAADNRRIYLKTSAGSTNAPFLLLIE